MTDPDALVRLLIELRQDAHKPLVVGAVDPRLVQELRDIDAAHDELFFLVVPLRPGHPLDVMHAVVEGEPGRCGAFVDDDGAVTPMGRCAPQKARREQEGSLPFWNPHAPVQFGVELESYNVMGGVARTDPPKWLCAPGVPCRPALGPALRGGMVFHLEGARRPTQLVFSISAVGYALHQVVWDLDPVPVAVGGVVLEPTLRWCPSDEWRLTVGGGAVAYVAYTTDAERRVPATRSFASPTATVTVAWRGATVALTRLELHPPFYFIAEGDLGFQPVQPVTTLTLGWTWTR